MPLLRISARYMLATFAFLVVASSLRLPAQQATIPQTIVPALVNFSGLLIDAKDKPVTSFTGVTFSLYAEQQGGSPLWLETQNVQPDKAGHYSVMLGATTTQGLPANLFASGQARWLGVKPQGQPEEPRTLLTSVPYAIKAVDAQTVGGLPASAFVLAIPPYSASPGSSSDGSSNGNLSTVSGSGKTDYIPIWTNSTTLGDSALYQSGKGGKAKLGINTTKPTSTLDVKGGSTVRGLFSLPATGTATAAESFNSQPIELTASVFNSGTGTAVTQNFRWQAEPVANDTSNPSGTLNLLFGQGKNKPTETGLNIASNGQITFAAGQTFPGTGTVTSVGSGLGIRGGPITTSGTLEIDTTVVPQLNVANTFTGNQTVNGNVSATGTVTGASYQIGSNLFAFGSYANDNALLGFAGNVTMTGGFNTASGVNALYANTTGYYNTASGVNALYANTTGSTNTATGVYALAANTTGGSNTASGFFALYSNTTANYNTAFGYGALYANTTGGGNTASGNGALSSNTTGGGNTASGSLALGFNSTGSANTAFGSGALQANTTGGTNTAIGETALYANTTGWNNTASGVFALSFNTTGNQDVADGASALQDNTTGYENTAVGAYALDLNQTGNDLTCIGYLCTVGSDGLTNATAIGAHAVVVQSNSLVLGGTGEWAVRVGIGTTAPSNILTIGRGLGHPVSDSWETYSSRRWKTNIKPLTGALEKVRRLRGVSYDLKDSGKHEIGVIAEEVGAVIPEVVSYEENGKDARGVDYSRLTALLIEATKEQQALIHKQQEQIRVQQVQMKAQRVQIARLGSQVKAIQVSLSKNGRTGEEVRTMKAQLVH
jgi:hypothetical protein